MRFLRVTRTNNPTTPVEEVIYVNSREVKYLCGAEEGGSLLHLIHEEVPMQVRESCEELLARLPS